MTDNKRTKLEKEIELLTTRSHEKSAQLATTRADLAAICESLSTESTPAKWDGLATAHGLTLTKINALVDELAVLAGKLRAARLALNDYDTAVVVAEVNGLLTENQGIRVKTDALRNEFRILCSKTTTDIETKQRVLDVKTEISQLELAGGLTKQQIEAAKRRRAELMEDREAIA